MEIEINEEVNTEHNRNLLRIRLEPYMEAGWLGHMLPYFASKSGKYLFNYLSHRKKFVRIFPDSKDTFNAFKYCAWGDVRVVIIGFSPYDRILSSGMEADGFAFSAGHAKTYGEIPNSTRAIFDEIENDCYEGKCNFNVSSGFSLRYLAEQGVLLMNQSLTTEENKSGSHMTLWSGFTDHVLKELGVWKTGVVYILMGEMPCIKSQIFEKTNWIIEAPSPDPMITNDFSGCKIFSKCNEILEGLNGKGIKW